MATIFGTNGNNVLNGGAENDIIFARGGADTVSGGDGDDAVLFEISPAGSDYFDGGAGDDGVLLDVELAQFDISPLTATNTNDELILLDTVAGVTLTVTDVEKVGFLDAVGYIVGFGSEIAGIQGALDEAAAGDVVLVQGGSYAGNFTIGSAVGILGVDSDSTGVSVSAASGNVFSLAGNLGAGNQVVIENIAVTGGENGIRIASNTQLGLLAVSNMDFSGLSGSGIITGSGAPGLDTVIITDTTFDGVGATGAVTAQGVGSIVLFGFNGDAYISDVAITNALTEGDAVNVRPDYAIHITGYDPLTYDVSEPAGTIVLSDITIEGTFHKNAISIQGFTSLSGITFDNVSIEGASDWGYLVFIDPIASSGAGPVGVNGYPGNFAGGEATSVIDLSGLIVTNLSANDVGFDVFVRGTDAADTQTGTESRDLLNAHAEGGIDYGGDDELFGMGGNDTLFAGNGSDEIDGGDGIDTAVYTDSVTGHTVEAIRVGDGPVTGFSAVSDNDSSDVDTLTDVEIVQFSDAVLDASLNVQMFDGADNLVGTFATIQEAVDAAADGYSIMLKTGTYQEQVVVDGIDDLTIAAFDGADVTILAPADVVETALSSSGRETHAVVTVLNSTNVTISGLEIDGAGVGNTISEGAGAGSANYVGVFFRNASGGLEDVDVTGIRDPYPGGTTLGGHDLVSGVQRGVGVQVDNDALMSFFMHGGSISDFQKNATAFVYADLDISGVAITGGGAQSVMAQNGIQALFSTGTIDDVTITGIGYAGSGNWTATSMLLYGNTDLDVTNNTIVGANMEDTNASSSGIYVLDFGSVSYTNSGGSITGNDISYVDYGIDVVGLVSPDSILVENNTFSNLDTTEPGYEGVGLYADPLSPVAFDTEGSDFADNLNGGAQGDTFDAFGGDDVLHGAGGDDTLNGGDGTDTAQYDGSRGDFAVTSVTETNGLVTGFSAVDDGNVGDGDEGTDTLTGIEVLEFGDTTLDTTLGVQLFDENDNLVGTFAEIQEAIDAADVNYTVRIKAGTYEENVVVDVEGLTIEGVGAVVIEGTFRDDNGIPDGTSVAEYVTVASGYTNTAGNGVTVAADNVTLLNLTINDFYAGIELGHNDGLTLTNVSVSDTINGVRKGTAAVVTDFEMTGGSITDTYIGMYIGAAIGAGAFDGVLIQGVLFQDLGEKGIYAEQLSNAQLLDLTMINVGEFGRGDPFGPDEQEGEFGGGIDINLKYGDYENIEIAGFEFTDVGSSAGVDNFPISNPGLDFGAAITVKARDDGSYSGNPATLDGVSIHDGTIDGTSTGIRIGEPGTNNSGPSNLVVEAVTILNADVSEIDNTSQATLTVIGTDDPDVYAAGDTSDGPIVIDGGAGDDTLSTGSGNDELTGGADDDTLDGNGGIDTAIVGTGVDFDATGASWAVTSSDGADSLSDIEVVEDGDGGTTLLVGSGGFTSIQAAVDAAGAIVGAVTILVADGTYNENVVIDRGDLTLLSVNGRDAVTIGDGTGSALGTIEIDPGANNVTIGGVGQGFTIIGLNGNGASEKGALYLQGAHDGIAILGNEIVANGDAGLMGESGFALTNILIDGNEFSGQTFVGAQPGGEGFGTQFDVGNNVPRQLVVLGNGGSGPWTSNNITFTNNLVSGTAGGVSSDTGNPQGNTLVTIDAANSLIADNTFTGFTDRYGVAIRARGPDTDIIDNTLDHTSGGQSRGIEVNYQGVPGTYTGNVVNGAATADVFFGMTPGGDVVHGNGGDDVVFAAGAGDDQLFGGADDDTLVGNDGNDLLDGGTGDDSLTGGLGDDTYRVDSTLDVVVESAGQGTDTIETTLSSYTLAESFENLTYAGAGNFVGRGNGTANVISGGDGEDRLQGRGGDDTLYGLDGDDRLYGNSGADTLVGGDGDDFYSIAGPGATIVELAGEGIDTVSSSQLDIDLSLFDHVEAGTLQGFLDLDLFGSTRGDRLNGNAGENTVVGGEGQDNMAGGGGADSFVFNDIDETGIFKANADIIVDFDGGIAGIDLIDLHGIDAKTTALGNNAFVWIGTDAFSGSAGELRYTFSNNYTRVEGDVDGDGDADFAIRLFGHIDLYDGNFIL